MRARPGAAGRWVPGLGGNEPNAGGGFSGCSVAAALPARSSCAGPAASGAGYPSVCSGLPTIGMDSPAIPLLHFRCN